MAFRDRCINLLKACKKAGKYLLFPLLALGKVINSGAQTSAGLTYSINYCRHIPSKPGESPYANADGLTLALSSIAFICNFELTAVTRLTALEQLIFDELPRENQGFTAAHFSSVHPFIYGSAYVVSTLSAYSALVFTTINSWLFGRNLTELCFMLGGIAADNPEWKETINTSGIIISSYQAFLFCNFFLFL